MFLLRLCHPVSFPRIWEPQSLDHLVAEHASTSNGIPWTIIDAMGSLLLRLCQSTRSTTQQRATAQPKLERKPRRYDYYWDFGHRDLRLNGKQQEEEIPTLDRSTIPTTLVESALCQFSLRDLPYLTSQFRSYIDSPKIEGARGALREHWTEGIRCTVPTRALRSAS